MILELFSLLVKEGFKRSFFSRNFTDFSLETNRKKKAHGMYGNFFKTEEQMAKLEAKKVKKTFSDSDSD